MCSIDPNRRNSLKIGEVEASDAGIVEASGFVKIVWLRCRNEQSTANIGPGLVSDVPHAVTERDLPLVSQISIIPTVANE